MIKVTVKEFFCLKPSKRWVVTMLKVKRIYIKICNKSITSVKTEIKQV